jgi:hypothetical protein
MSESRRAPYVHDQHHPDHGVRSASSWCVVATADGVIRTTTMGGGRRRRLGARRRCEAASYAIAQPRPIASSAVAASREGTHNQVLVRSRPANGFARRAERGGPRRGLVAALSSHECSGDAGSPDRAQRRGVEAFGGSFAVSRRGTSVGICAPASACPLESVIDCSPRALAGPGGPAR